MYVFDDNTTLAQWRGLLEDVVGCDKAIVGSPTGPAMAGPLFCPKWLTKMAWDVLSTVTEMAFGVFSRLTEMALYVLFTVA